MRQLATHAFFFWWYNPVPFLFWWRESVLKCEKVYKCFIHDCLKLLLFEITSLKMHWNSKNHRFLAEKKNFFENTVLLQLGQCLVPISFFTLNCKIALSEIYQYLGICFNGDALTTNLKSEWIFWNSKIFRKCGIMGSGQS